MNGYWGAAEKSAAVFGQRGASIQYPPSLGFSCINYDRGKFWRVRTPIQGRANGTRVLAPTHHRGSSPAGTERPGNPRRRAGGTHVRYPYAFPARRPCAGPPLATPLPGPSRPSTSARAANRHRKPLDHRGRSPAGPVAVGPWRVAIATCPCLAARPAARTNRRRSTRHSRPSSSCS